MFFFLQQQTVEEKLFNGKTERDSKLNLFFRVLYLLWFYSAQSSSIHLKSSFLCFVEKLGNLYGNCLYFPIYLFAKVKCCCVSCFKDVL